MRLRRSSRAGLAAASLSKESLLEEPGGHTLNCMRCRYRQKRHERNFKKRIKYMCRKTLADSRPRVRGRFARNDDTAAVMPHETKKALAEKARKEKKANGTLL